ncbi:hypothetical protein [Veillonella sp.]|uniref:hypothetical protein n=1 Tax=Veillonella sp. TaxID=1926307 RepID=UPI00290A7EDD|nr:hypothetical protein [Veillonella sp.]MDU3434644.1 hypothetical protein [Veillonella sp.]
MLGISLFLMFLYCLYFIKHPYFELKKVNIKRSKVMLYTEVGNGILSFILLNIAYYADVASYRIVATIGFSMIAILFCPVELWIRKGAIIQDPELDNRIKVVLVKKAKWDFYTVLPIVICSMLMFIFNIIADINSLGNGTY